LVVYADIFVLGILLGSVVWIKENSFYVESFKSLFGKDIFKNDENAYIAMTQAIASFERRDEFSPFDSKYDRYLKNFEH
jgi:cytochrome c peroxidase